MAAPASVDLVKISYTEPLRIPVEGAAGVCFARDVFVEHLCDGELERELVARANAGLKVLLAPFPDAHHGHRLVSLAPESEA